MTSDQSTSNASTPPWQGIHHIALSTGDLDATIQFYQDVLGMELLFRGEAGFMHGRSASLLPGGNFMGLHFFEVENAQIFTPPDLEKMYWLPGALHHIAFALPDEKTALALHEQLLARGIKTTGVMDQGDTVNFVFPDNNGILLEANWPKI